MGLASSQARMMLLTARKSDLEYRAQMINQRKINLGIQTQELATKYSNRMSNRSLSLAYYTEGSNGQALLENLTFAGLLSENGNSGTFLVKNASGKYVYRNASDVTLAFQRLVENNQIEYEEQKAGKDYKVNAEGYMLDAEGNATNYKVDKDGYLTVNGERIQETQEQAFSRFLSEQCDGTYYSSVNNNSLLDNTEYFQDALRNGALFLQQLTSVNGGEENEFKDISYSSVTTIYDHLNTDDDDEAQAEYEAKSIILSNQDKRLDLELQQIQTQHKAIETEYDSVKKVIEKNIDVTFKIFS